MFVRVKIRACTDVFSSIRKSEKLTKPVGKCFKHVGFYLIDGVYQTLMYYDRMLVTFQMKVERNRLNFSVFAFCHSPRRSVHFIVAPSSYYGNRFAEDNKNR